jgi:hypothetical protein
MLPIPDGYEQDERGNERQEEGTDFSVSLLGGATTQRNRIRAMKVFEI